MPPSSPGPGAPTVLDLLDLEDLDRDLFRSVVLLDDQPGLYGGQVAAQALVAAGRTVPDDRRPHSLHGYFLRGGDATRPTVFRVERDRDGRSSSARRVVALQRGEVIFSAAASFTAGAGATDPVGPEVADADGVPGPEGLPVVDMHGLFSLECRQPPQPAPDGVLPTRFWARATVPLPDRPLLHAGVLTYLSDASSGLLALPGVGGALGPSVDHAVWFHRPARLDDWVLVDLVPGAAAAQRGWYTGSVRDRAGSRVASLAQEALFRRGAGR